MSFGCCGHACLSQGADAEARKLAEAFEPGKQA